jgi:HK97 family phage prohead protease
MTETRFIKATELRSVGPRQIAGLAAPYNVRGKVTTKDGARFLETICAGAFDKILRSNPDVVCTFNHDSNRVLGRTTSGTLRLSANNRGLNFVCDLPDTQFARDLHQSIQRRDIAGNSFAFNLGPGDDDYSEVYDDDEDRSRIILRTIGNFTRLVDVSPVTHPCYEGTELSARCCEVSAEVRSQLQRFGVVAPRRPVKTNAEMDRQFAEFQRQLAENEASHNSRKVARKKNLLSQI